MWSIAVGNSDKASDGVPVAKPNAKNAIALATNLSMRFGGFDDNALKKNSNI